MGLMIFLITCILLTITMLLYFVAIKYKSWITTFAIIFVMMIGTAAGITLYENLGYAKSVITMSQDFEILNYVVDDSKQTFYIMVREKNINEPRLLSFNITDKENFKKQKDGIESVDKGQKEGLMFKGKYDIKKQEFEFHQLQMNQIIEKKKK